MLINVLNTYVVTVCLVMKLPQVYNIVKAGNVKSVSLSSVLLEFYCYTCTLLYQSSKGYPVGTYLEFVFLYLQDVFLILLITYHQKLFNYKLTLALIFYVASIMSIRNELTPPWLLLNMLRLIGPTLIASRFFQWFAIFKAKDSGQVSALTWTIAVSTSLSRCATTLLGTGDKNLLTNQIIASTVSFIMVVTVLIYRSDKKAKEL